jgi:predicted membrane channel-forming protein YqfA (hemolysin III family)
MGGNVLCIVWFYAIATVLENTPNRDSGLNQPVACIFLCVGCVLVALVPPLWQPEGWWFWKT